MKSPPPDEARVRPSVCDPRRYRQLRAAVAQLRRTRRPAGCAGQQAALALQLVPMYEAEAKEREQQRKLRSDDETSPADRPDSSRHDRESVERAAKAAGTSGTSVKKARRVSRDASWDDEAADEFEARRARGGAR